MVIIKSGSAGDFKGIRFLFAFGIQSDLKSVNIREKR